MVKLSLSFAFLLFLFPLISNADTGCVMNYNSSTEVVYPTSIGPAPANTSRTNYTGPITYNDLYYPTSCPKYRWISLAVSSTRCCISNVCDNSFRIAEYSPINCPIDNYIPWLILPAGIFALFSIKRNKTVLFL